MALGNFLDCCAVVCKERKAMQQEPLRSGAKKIRCGINNELERTDTNSRRSEFVRVRISSLLTSILLFSLRPLRSLRLNVFSASALARAACASFAVEPRGGEGYIVGGLEGGEF